MDFNVTDAADDQTLNFSMLNPGLISWISLRVSQANSTNILLYMIYFLPPKFVFCRDFQYCPFDNSDCSAVAIDISFRFSIKKPPTIHNIAYLYQHAYWNSLRDFLCDTLWNDIENCATEVSSWVKWNTDSFISSRKYQMKPQYPHCFTPVFSVRYRVHKPLFPTIPALRL